MMADVHRTRLGTPDPPFTYTSVDYFGPIEVVHGQRSVSISTTGSIFQSLISTIPLGVLLPVSLKVALCFLMVSR